MLNRPFGGGGAIPDWGKRVYARRKETVERSFADAKQLHGHRYARMRGLSKVLEQCLLAATAQNMKKIALLLARFLRPFTRLRPRDRLASRLLAWACGSIERKRADLRRNAIDCASA